MRRNKNRWIRDVDGSWWRQQRSGRWVHKDLRTDWPKTIARWIAALICLAWAAVLAYAISRLV